MTDVNTGWWGSLTESRSTAFLIAGVIFVADAVLLAYMLSAGTEQFLELGQAFVGAGWTAAFIGLLGFYPNLADRSRWPARIGTLFAAIGAVVMAAMSVTSLSYFTGILSGSLGDVAMYFLPLVFVGIVFGFGAFGVASLTTDVYARSVGGLFLLLPLTFLFNLATGITGIVPEETVLGVVLVLALTNIAIGYLLRTGSARLDGQGAKAASETTVG